MTVTQLRSVAGAPEVGQLVRVRDRRWVVSDVAASTLSEGEHRQHLIELACVEDDGLGDELSVIWEIEPGKAVLDTATLPRPQLDRFDDPSRLDAFLDAVRWGAITSADSRALQAPFRSGITIEDCQLDPVVRALQMPRVNLLIADDVGLGKTIEAGLIVQELLLRHRARTVLVVCPASRRRARMDGSDPRPRPHVRALRCRRQLPQARYARSSSARLAPHRRVCTGASRPARHQR